MNYGGRTVVKRIIPQGLTSRQKSDWIESNCIRFHPLHEISGMVREVKERSYED